MIRRFVCCLVVLTAFVSPAAAQATNFVVNTTAPEAPEGSGFCGLSNAFYAANADLPSGDCPAGEGADRIEFDIPLPAQITLPGLPLQATGLGGGSKITVVGPGADQLTISGGDTSRVFEVGNEEGKFGESGDLTLSGLTIADGRRPEIGAGLYVQKASVARLDHVVVRDNEVVGSGKFAEGAGIMNQGELFLADSTVTGNVARNTSATPEAESNGAGITSADGFMSSQIKVVIERSTISNNSTITEAATEKGHARGGGLFIFTLTELIMRDSTVTGNRVEINAGTENEANGGGISFFPVPGATIANSTVAGNTAVAGSTTPQGANLFTQGTVSVGSTILAKPLGGGADCATNGAGAITSLGYNLDEGTSCGFGPADQSGVDPLLKPLAANGGPTETMALENGSPAVDKGLASVGETTDQRGLRRPVEIPSVANASGGDGTDVGAFELQVPRAAIDRGPGDGETIADRAPVFGFSADGAATGFVCSLDGAEPASCTSPLRSPELANGSHTFTVAALGEAGYAGEAASRTFVVDVRAPEPPKPEGQKKPDQPKEPTAAPRPKIGNVPAKTTKRYVKIRFSATESGSTFKCKLDSRKWRRCSSPYTTPKLQLGKHVFKLKAIGRTGLSSKPSQKTFRVVAPPGRQ